MVVMRMVFNLSGIGEHHFFKTPTVEISYLKNVATTHWKCDFNGETILEKIDNHGFKTILLLDRNQLTELEHNHENELAIHADFQKWSRLTQPFLSSTSINWNRAFKQDLI